MRSEKKEKSFISVVTYLYNCEERILPFLEFICKQLEEQFENYELIFVDDACEDHTISYLKEFVEKNSFFAMTHIIHMGQFQGIEASMNAGVDLAIGDFVYEFDSTLLDYPPEMIRKVYEHSLEGYDIVAASPDDLKELESFLFYKIYNLSSAKQKKEEMRRETFRILSRRAINRIQSFSKSNPYRKALYQSCGLPFDYLMYHKTVKQEVKYNKKQRKKRKETGIESMLLFTDFLHKVSFLLCILFLGFTVGVYTILAYCFGKGVVEGWVSLMGFLSVGFTGIFLLITIMMRYLAEILKMIFNKQRYLVESIEKVTK